MIRLGQPWSLLVLLLFLFVILRLRVFPTGSALRRGAAWLCLALALAGPEVVVRGAPEAVVFALDLSASSSRFRAEVWARTEALVREVSAAVPVAIVAFGESAYVLRARSPAASRTDRSLELRRIAVEADQVVPAVAVDETDVAGALALAARLLPTHEGGRIVLITDGWETRGEARHAAISLAARGIAVDVVAIGDLSPGFVDAAVEDVEAPAQVLRGVPFEVRASIRSTVEGVASVTLLDGEMDVAHQELRTSAGTTPVRFTAVGAVADEHRYRVRVAVAGDREPRNDVASAAVSVLGAPRILWVGVPPIVHFADLDTMTIEPAGLASSLSGLSGWDAVVLADVAAASLPPGVAERLRRFVGDEGGGLLMVGGPRSFALGGYRGTPVEDALPVDLDPASRRTRTPLALVLVVDTSGSMAEPFGQRPKIEAARDAVAVTASLLEPGDRVGVVAFNQAPVRLVPLGEPPGREPLQKVLARLEPGGGTRILPAIAEAAALLSPVAGRRHIVLVTDGRGEGGDFELRARELVARGITLSAVAVGDDADVETLRVLAASGGGRFEVARDAARLASALRREVVLARGPVLREEPTRVIANPHPVLGGLSARIPPITGYISTAPKALAAVPLRSERGDPILALGSYGLGRAAALTTDFGGPGTAAWRNWDGVEPLMAQVLRWVARAPIAAQLTIAEEHRHNGRALVVRAEDAQGNRLNGRSFAGRLQARDAEHVIALEQEGPGLYAGALSFATDRPIRAVIEDRSDGAARSAGQGWIGLGYPGEYRVRGPNRVLLGDLIRITRGHQLDDSRAALALRPMRSRVISLTLWLPVIALVLLLLELALTRRASLRTPVPSRRARAEASPTRIGQDLI